jgi:hypothetical protein
MAATLNIPSVGEVGKLLDTSRLAFASPR